MPWRPSVPGELPTLGHGVLDWIISNLGAPDREDYEPFVPTREQAEFTLGFYALDPVTCKRVVRRGVLSRARGWGKSPFLSSLALAEGLADVVPAGWDADGRPVGKPWARVRTPLVQVAAASESQTQNAWEPLLEMVRGTAPVMDNYPGLEPMGSFVNLPWGRIEPVTSSVTSAKGKRPVFALADQTEQWTRGNGGVHLFEVMVNNATKVGGSIIEAPNAYTPGMGSVAEATAAAYFAQVTGRARLGTGLLYDHREAAGIPDMGERDALVAGLRFAYGCSSDHPGGCVLHDPPCPPGWAPIDNFVARIWDLDSEEQTSRADFLNQITHAPDAWLSSPVWANCADPSKVVRDGDVVVLGLDGSRGKAKGKPDATALVGCRVWDGHVFEIGIWEAGDDRSTWDQWQPPIVEIEAAIATAFRRFNVVGFYADPARDWRSHVNAWEAKYGRRVKLRVRQDHPFEWWMTGGRATAIEQAVEQAEGAIRNADMTHDGSFRLTQHVLHARRKLVHGKLALGKSSSYSEDKIDGAVALTLVWQARLDAVAKGLDKVRGGRSRVILMS